jgi:hypothetical protein
MATRKKTVKKTTLKALPPVDYSKPQKVEIPAIGLHRVRIPIAGTSDLVTHGWNGKVIREMEAKQQGHAKLKKAPKVPEECFEAAKYKDANGNDCIKAKFFKAAMVGAGRFMDGLNMRQLKMSLFVDGDDLPLEFESCEMRQDMVRLSTGVADIRYRPGYKNWKTEIVIEYPPSEISLSQILTLVRLAGQRVGICEGRPEKSATLQWGRFDIDMERAGTTIASEPLGSPKKKVA